MSLTRTAGNGVLSLVTFFGPAKKATRLPAGTGDLKNGLIGLPTPNEPPLFANLHAVVIVLRLQDENRHEGFARGAPVT